MPAKMLLGGLAVAFLALVSWAFVHAGADDLDALLGSLWGRVTLADLYLGFLTLACVIALAERSWWAGVAWGIPLCLLGSPVAVVWLLARGWARLAPSVDARREVTEH